MLDLKRIDKTWTLFLDRDGVINEEKQNEYILHWDFFIFSSGVLGAVKKLNDSFGRIVIVTNQKGVSKELMSLQDLHLIHRNMQDQIVLAGGHIDKIYYCIDLDNDSLNRKPNHGMALQAQKDFPEINFSKAIMVGNKITDMQFGRAAGMYTVFVTTTNPEQPFPHPAIDLVFPTLGHFAEAL